MFEFINIILGNILPESLKIGNGDDSSTPYLMSEEGSIMISEDGEILMQE